ncbi:MAG: DNA recombination protein RmuC [Alphaproteobacteria bacterium]|nr:DNA recombination protein RmuC [Alphaproteobacteria bacterium]
MDYNIDLSKLNMDAVSLNQLSLEPISLVIGLAGGILLGALFYLWRSSALKAQKAALEARMEAERASLEDSFQSLAQQTLQSNAESFLNIAQEKLKQAQGQSAHDLDKRTQAISAMVQPVEKQLGELQSAVKILQGTDQALREDLKTLSKETSRLTGALKNPAAQGKWGEFVLERLLDKANLMKGVHYQTQVSIETNDGRLRPDAVIYLQDGFNIIVDAKAPITEFINRMDDVENNQGHQELRQGLAKAVRSHVRALGSKNYWDQLDGPDFVVLFLPSENIFSTALAADPELVDFASDNNIVIASPTLMMSLLRVVGLSWRQVEMAKNAQEVSKLGAELFERINSFSAHLGKVGGGINAALNAYNKAIGTFDARVLVSARKLKDLHVTDKDVVEPQLLEGGPRPILAQEDIEDDSDDGKDKAA